MAKLRKQYKLNKRRQALHDLVRFWPVAAGLVFACFAPLLRDLIAPCGPWGMRLLFPFVELSARQEIQFGGQITQALPQVMLYAQFPCEGLLAGMALRSRVTFSGVAGQLFFFHFLAAVELWLISGALLQTALR